MSVRVYIDMPNAIGDNIEKLYAIAEMKDGTRVVSGGDIMVWAKGQTAQWVKNDAVINSHIFCSNCLTRCKDDIPTKYCPGCGFLMEDGGEQIANETNYN